MVLLVLGIGGFFFYQKFGSSKPILKSLLAQRYQRQGQIQRVAFPGPKPPQKKSLLLWGHIWEIVV